MGWKNKFAGGLAGLLLAGCIDEPFFDKEKGEQKIQKEVVELPKEDLEDIGNISNNYITFDEAKNFKKGDILIGGVSPQTPGGILRKVSSVENGGKKVRTQPASLEEVFEKEKLSYTQTLDYEDLDLEKSLKNGQLKIQVSYENLETKNKLKSVNKEKGIRLNIPKTIIYDLDGNENTTNDQTWINGYVDFYTTYDLYAEFDGGLKKFKFKPEITQESNITVGGKLEKAINKEITLAQSTFMPITLPGPGVPIVLRPKIEFNAGIVGQTRGEFEFGASAMQKASLGLEYERGDWNIIKNYEKSFNFDKFEGQSNMEYYAYVNPRVTVVVNELVGPFVELSGGLEMYANTNENPWWYLNGKIEANAGVDMNFLSFLIPEYNKNFYEYSKRIAEAQGGFGEGGGETDPNEEDPNEEENTKPNAYFAINPKKGDLETEFMFNANVTSDNEDERYDMYYRWDFDGDGVWNENWEKGNDLAWHYYSQPGQYRAKMQVKDLGGLVDSFEADALVKDNSNNEPGENEEIEYSTYTDPRDGQEYDIMNVNGTWWFKENFNGYTPESIYPENDSVKNHDFGRTYALKEAIKYCPAGWKLPTIEDYVKLIKYVEPEFNIEDPYTPSQAGTKLKAKGSRYWSEAYGEENNATDIIGFSAKGTGYSYLESDITFHFRVIADFLTNERFSEDRVYCIQFNHAHSGILKQVRPKETRGSIRYIKKEN